MNPRHGSAFVAAALVAIACPPANAQDPSWTGEQVVPTRRAANITFGDEIDGKRFRLKFSGRWPLKILDDRDGRLRVHDGDREAWADKSQFVLARDAVAHFTRRVKADATDAWALAMRGAVRLQNGEPDAAIRDLDTAVRLDATDPAAFNTRGLAWAAKSEYDRAIRDYDAAVRLDPDTTNVYYNRGVAWHGRREYDKAVRDYDEAIRRAPGHAMAWNNRGLVWADRQEYDRAIRDYDAAARLAPDSALVRYNRGNARQDRREFDKAIRDFDEAIRLDPRSSYAYNNRGLARSRKREFGEAIRDYDEAVRLDPKFAAAYYDRGVARSTTGEYGKAIRDFDEAVRLDSKYPFAHYFRGVARSFNLEHDKAIRDFDEAIRLDPKYAWSHYHRAVASMLTRRPDAPRGFQVVLDAEGWKGELALYAVILGHVAARQAGDEATANRFASEAAGKLVENWPAPVVRFFRGEIDEAALLALADDDGKRTEARCFLGLHHAAANRRAEALAHFRWVKDHGSASFTEYPVAITEMGRLERAAK